MRYIVEISDVDDHTFQVALSIPLLSSTSTPANSSWRVRDEGFLRHRAGGCHRSKKFGYVPTGIGLCWSGKWGLLLDALFDEFGLVNSSGEGEVLQPWCISLKPGPIGWTLIS